MLPAEGPTYKELSSAQLGSGGAMKRKVQKEGNKTKKSVRSKLKSTYSHRRHNTARASDSSTSRRHHCPDKVNIFQDLT